MDKKILLNDFATRCFRDVADQDYIAARLSYRHGLYPQFHWQSLQAIEKYLKAILLYNRIKATKVNHHLDKALELTKSLPFDLAFSKVANKFIEHLSAFGRFRYLETSYFIRGPKLVELDRTVWDLRRYCKVLNYDLQLGNESRNMLQTEIAAIEQSELRPPHKFGLVGGLLEKVIATPRHPSRSALIWQNLYFGAVSRPKVTVPTPSLSVNSPLYLHPEILDDVLEFVHVPNEVVKAFREALNKK